MTHRTFSRAPAVVAGAAIALAASTAVAPAQEDLGRAEYLDACASCHGTDGHGGGEVAKYLTVAVPDLTKLSAANGGVFPMLDVIHVIDGRSGVRAHGAATPVWGTSLRLSDAGAGSPDTPMPVWGELYRAAIGEAAGPFSAEVIVRGRMLSLALYLESIQTP